MSYLKFFLVTLCFAICPLIVMAKPNKQVVVFSCEIHCQGCIDKIMKNIAFEKGVKDIQCDLDSKTVTVTFDANKTDVPALEKAFAKIGKPVVVRVQNTDRGADRVQTDAETGASTPM